uniref:Putative ovule protein n=1 Tax=Solanum chacoense TaxID=4108 RepID=A0A0V0GMC7_SOLCH
MAGGQRFICRFNPFNPSFRIYQVTDVTFHYHSSRKYTPWPTKICRDVVQFLQIVGSPNSAILKHYSTF